MNIEFNLNFKSLVAQQRTLNFSSELREQNQSNASSSLPSDRFSSSSEIEALGLYQEKQVLKADAIESPLPAGFARVPKISPEQASSNILGFIENRLLAEKAGGASDEELSDLMAQAREGVETGYGLAKDDLEALNMLSEGLSEEVGESYSQVQDGLNALEQKLFGEGDEVVQQSADSQPEVDDSSAAQSPSQNQTASASVSEPSIRSASNFRYGERASSDFQLVTQDGDVVSIQFSSRLAFQNTTVDSVGRQASIERFAASASFEFSVEGDLDNEEIAAINDLIAQLSEVSAAFFGGDFAAAFNQALKLGFDGEQIAEFSLNLRQSQFQSAQTYANASASNSNLNNQFGSLVNQTNRLEAFGDLFNSAVDDDQGGSKLAQLLSETIDNLERFNKPFEDEFRLNLDQFIARILV